MDAVLHTPADESGDEMGDDTAVNSPASGSPADQSPAPKEEPANTFWPALGSFTVTPRRQYNARQTRGYTHFRRMWDYTIDSFVKLSTSVSEQGAGITHHDGADCFMIHDGKASEGPVIATIQYDHTAPNTETQCFWKARFEEGPPGRTYTFSTFCGKADTDQLAAVFVADIYPPSGRLGKFEWRKDKKARAFHFELIRLDYAAPVAAAETKSERKKSSKSNTKEGFQRLARSSPDTLDFLGNDALGPRWAIMALGAHLAMEHIGGELVDLPPPPPETGSRWTQNFGLGFRFGTATSSTRGSGGFRSSISFGGLGISGRFG